MRRDIVLFDFDGTLADSEALMIASLNALAERFGFNPITGGEFQELRKMPMRSFITKRLEIPLWRVVKLLRLEKKSKREYARQSEGLKLFPGMAQLISFLRTSGRTVGIVASTPEAVIERVLRESGAEVDFIQGGVGTFTKSRAMRKVLRSRDIAKARAVYVGDELRDLDACGSAKIAMIGVGWGLNTPESLKARGISVASTPAELLSMLQDDHLWENSPSSRPR